MSGVVLALDYLVLVAVAIERHVEAHVLGHDDANAIVEKRLGGKALDKMAGQRSAVRIEACGQHNGVTNLKIREINDKLFSVVSVDWILRPDFLGDHAGAVRFDTAAVSFLRVSLQNIDAL